MDDDLRKHGVEHPVDRVLIRGGSFWMGAQWKDGFEPGYDPEAYDNEAPVHRVTLSDFWISRYPVTVGQYKKFLESGHHKPSRWEEQVIDLGTPVVGVSWHDANAYCRWLSGKTGCEVSLPTEAQWEFAARGEKGRRYPWGDAAPTGQHANFKMNVGHATPVGIYPLGATPEGVWDLAGNVWEWCQDWRGEYRPEEQRDPIGPSSGPGRVLRGGGFINYPRSLRAACRLSNGPEFHFGSFGFRCVVSGAGGQTQ